MQPITLTEKASQYISERIKKEKALGFRLTVKKTGCSGFSYVPKVIHTINPADIFFESGDISVFVDLEWLSTLQDIVVDYIEEEKAGIKQKRLVFFNKKETSRCGCGESFHIE